MKKNDFKKIAVGIVLFVAMFYGISCYAYNPIVQTIYTADPAPMVYNDTLYMYTGHDEDGSGWFNMKDWRCFSTTDMVNWTVRGTPMKLSTFSWATVDAWASQCIARNGKFYWYMCTRISGDNFGIGVGVSDRPEGPFTDAIGKPLLEGISYLDPGVFIDDDGQAYMYFGNSSLWYVKLNPDMISIADTVVKVTETQRSFGNEYSEGPYMHKRNGLYYLIYAADDPKGEHISYSTSTTPIGPWAYRGVVMPYQIASWTSEQGVSWTNHPALCDYKGNSYFIYHNAALPGGGRGTRSVCIEQFNYTSSNLIPSLTMTAAGPSQIGSLNPYNRTEAECIAWEEGVETEISSKVGVYVTSIDDGDYIHVKGVDFGSTGAGTFSLNASCATRAGMREGGTIELHLDSINGYQIGVMPISYTGGKDIWREKTISVLGATGNRDLYLVFKGNARTDMFNADYWKFEEKTSDHTLAAIIANVDKFKIDKVSGLNTTPFQVLAVYSDGTSEDVTASAVITPSQNGIVSVANGVITGVTYGSVNLNISYEGQNDTLKMLVSNITNELTLSKITSTIGDTWAFTGKVLPYTLKAVFNDAHTEDITKVATCTNSDTTVAVMSNGTFTAKSVGTTTIVFSYQGELGTAKTVTLNVNVLERGPYVRFEAEEWSGQSGVGTETNSDINGRLDVAYIETGDWIKYSALDFGAGASSFEARVASAGVGGTIELRLDSNTGQLIGKCTVPVTGGWQTWATKSCSVSGVTGTHDLCLVFKGNTGSLFNINWWTFTPINTGIDNVTTNNRPYIKVVNGESWLLGIKNGCNVLMYDISGKTVFQGMATDTQFLLPKVKSGIYLVKVETDTETITLKEYIF